MSAYEPEYQPPADGASDSADPLFRAKLKTCGRCGRCRQTNAVRFPDADRTFPVSRGRARWRRLDARE